MEKKISVFLSHLKKGRGYDFHLHFVHELLMTFGNLLTHHDNMLGLKP